MSQVAPYKAPEYIKEEVVRAAELFIINEDPLAIARMEKMFPNISREELENAFELAIESIKGKYAKVNASMELTKSLLINDILLSSTLEILQGSNDAKVKLGSIDEMRNLSKDRVDTLVKFGMIERLSPEAAAKRMHGEKVKKDKEAIEDKSTDEVDDLIKRTDSIGKPERTD